MQRSICRAWQWNKRSWAWTWGQDGQGVSWAIVLTGLKRGPVVRQAALRDRGLGGSGGRCPQRRRWQSAQQTGPCIRLALILYNTTQSKAETGTGRTNGGVATEARRRGHTWTSGRAGWRGSWGDGDTVWEGGDDSRRLLSLSDLFGGSSFSVVSLSVSVFTFYHIYRTLYTRQVLSRPSTLIASKPFLLNNQQCTCKTRPPAPPHSFVREIDVSILPPRFHKSPWSLK